jgi:hypothetical protein
LPRLVVGHRTRARDDGTGIVARVVTSATTRPVRGEAVVEIRVADRRLAEAISRRVVASLEGAMASLPVATAERVVRFRTNRRLAELEASGLDGALAIVRVTVANARRLGEYAERACAAGAVGVQLVWDGESPPRDRVERWVFDALERARAAPKRAPVVLARTSIPLEILRMWARATSDTKRKEPR